MEMNPKNHWKTVTWIIEIVFLFLSFTAPLNPLLQTKRSVFIWCFIMIGLGGLAVILALFKAYPPEEFPLQD